MWLRGLMATVVIVGFILLANFTPLKDIVFLYEDAAETYGGLNEIQIIESDEVTTTIMDLEKDATKELNDSTLSKPKQIEIPTLKVIAPVKEAGLTKSGAMATFNDAKTIAWYKYGAIPGQDGNAILAGHKDYNGKLGTLFYLEKMKKDETIVITYEDGRVETFGLVSNTLYPLDKVPSDVMELNGKQRLTIITCGGKFDREKGGYQSRVVTVFEKK